jgi:hypothetical protein
MQSLKLVKILMNAQNQENFFFDKEDSDKSNKSMSSNNSNYSNQSRISLGSSYVNSINLFPSFLSVIIFYLSSTELEECIEKISEFIRVESSKDKSNIKDIKEEFIFFIKALKSIKKQDILDFKKYIEKLDKIYEEKKEKILKQFELEKKNIFIFHNLLLDNIGIIKNKKGQIIHGYQKASKGSGKTEKEAIEEFEKGIKFINENIKELEDLFFANVIKYDSKSKKYDIAYKCHFLINTFPKDTNINTIEYYFEKQEIEKIYKFGKILILLFDTSNNKDYEIKYEMEMKLKLYDGKTENFSLDAIVYEDKNKNEYVIKKKNEDNEKGKKFDNNEIVDIYFDDSIKDVIMLMYKKN